MKGFTNLEEQICQATANEGIGSLYERIILKRFLEKLAKEHRFFSVLEYLGTEITKGFDNLLFLSLGKKVVVSGNNLSLLAKSWPFSLRPNFAKPSALAPRFDLVWNFAVIQRQPEILKTMKGLSQKYLLVFTPNLFNWGGPFHWGYHLLTHQPCQHAERGHLFLRTLEGLKKILQDNNIHLLQAGYIDLPPLPDIGFSLKEAKTWLGIKSGQGENRPADPGQTIGKINRLAFLEKAFLPKWVKLFFAHHLYALGRAS